MLTLHDSAQLHPLSTSRRRKFAICVICNRGNFVTWPQRYVIGLGLFLRKVRLQNSISVFRTRKCSFLRSWISIAYLSDCRRTVIEDFEEFVNTGCEECVWWQTCFMRHFFSTVPFVGNFFLLYQYQNFQTVWLGLSNAVANQRRRAAFAELHFRGKHASFRSSQ